MDYRKSSLPSREKRPYKVAQLFYGGATMLKRALLALVLIGGLLSLLWLAVSQSTTSKSLTNAGPSTTSSVPSKEAVSAKLATLERGWVKNEGQWDQRALFSAPGYFGTTWITKDGELLHVAVKKEERKDKTTKAKACPSKSWVISERWVGGKVQAIKGEEELQTKVSYFIGDDPSKHKSNLPTYRYVSLSEVWSGVQVQLKATQKTVEKLFYVQPGADPSKIVVQVDGAEGLRLSKDGEIIIQTGLGELKLSKPIAWQEKDDKKLPVEVSYKLIGKNRYSFEVAKADPSLPIVIDPILQATYLGGSGNEEAVALAIHPAADEVYVAGNTTSTDFPNITGGAQRRCNNCFTDVKDPNYDVFVTKLNKELTQILQSTYLGGRGNDEAIAFAIHPTTGEVYVAGQTFSTNFPGTTGGAQTRHGGGYSDAFVARLNSSLTQILQSTYLGGSGWDYATALAIHPTTGEVYVAGNTTSTGFPKITGGAQKSRGGKGDAFVARLNKELTRIIQSTYLGGSDDDWAFGLAIHPTTGDVYVAGCTYSYDFPKITGGAQTRHGGGYSDAFVARLNKELNQILQSTYLGGKGSDCAWTLAIHPITGEVYVAGETWSDNLPNTAGGAQAKKQKYDDAFVARLNKELTQILQSTYLGGDNTDSIRALAVHPTTGEVYVAGWTASKDFPNTTGGAQARRHENINVIDAFVARLNADLTQILQSTYLGGSSYDYAKAFAIHPITGEVYVAGITWSDDFPNTTGGAQASYGGGYKDAFVARLSADLAAGRSAKDGSSGSPKTASVSSTAGLWNILLLLSVPAFALAKRIRKR
jgi:muconolactone delta-isomerase